MKERISSIQPLAEGMELAFRHVFKHTHARFLSAILTPLPPKTSF